MIKGEYKKILYEIFDVLELYEHEKEKVLEGFKKKFATEMLMEIKDSLTDDQKNWIADVSVKKEYNKDDPRIAETQKTINDTYPPEKMDKTARVVFKRILISYSNFMASKLSPEKSQKLIDIVNKFQS
jgi:hypothetical protein